MERTVRVNSTTSASQSIVSETEYLQYLIGYAVENQFSVAVWRLPNDPVRHLILSRKHRMLPKDTSLEELPAGFIFSPFDPEKDKTFLPADFKFSFTNEALHPAEDSIEANSHTWLQEQLKQTPLSTRSITPFFHASAQHTEGPIPYIHLVQQSIEAIEKGLFEKVVPSRQKMVDLPAEFDVVDAFQNLCRTYPNALVSFVSSAHTGSWLGATPETLVCVADKTIFKTVALAGTKSYEPGTDLKTVAWTQKEIEEQALVERYIISCFKKIRVREYDEHGPKTTVAGNLLHLKSDFTIDMKAINFPQLGSVMLQLLHPTSAVCGMPLQPASDFLKKHEGYDREFYAGYLGPVNINKDIHVFVNIRCMKLLDSKAWVYAGAGVTQDSIPENEYQETEMKLNTLLKVLK